MAVYQVFWVLLPELVECRIWIMIIPPANQSPALTALERSVLETALTGMGADGDFHSQIEAATVTLRTPSGVGFMTKLSVPDECQGVSKEATAVIPVVIGEHPALPSGAEFILQIKNGRLNCIEGFCHEGMWPADEMLFNIYADS